MIYRRWGGGLRARVSTHRWDVAAAAASSLRARGRRRLLLGGSGGRPRREFGRADRLAVAGCGRAGRPPWGAGAATRTRTPRARVRESREQRREELASRESTMMPDDIAMMGAGGNEGGEGILRQRKKPTPGADDPADGADAAETDRPKSEAEIAREHQLQRVKEYKKKRNKVIGCIFGTPVALFLLGLATGVLTLEAPREDVTCTAIEDRELCEEMSQGEDPQCCYDTIGRNCSFVDGCQAACAEGYESLGNTGVEPCLRCEPGMHDHDRLPTTECESCPPGTYSPAESVECAPCEAGTADTDDDPSTLCDACGSGQFVSEGWYQTTGESPNLEYQALEDQPADGRPSYPARCVLCPPGKHDHDGGAGGVSESARTTCQDCAVGQYTSAQGQFGSCQGCETGTYARSGQASCSSCPAGRYDSDSNPATECVDCPAGRIQPSAGVTQCEVCSAGTKSNSARTSCETCGPGTYASAEADDCAACLAGQADIDEDAATECESCSGSSYAAESRQTECEECGEGSYRESSTGCSQCPAGKSDHDSDSLTDCLTCAAGSVTLDPGLSECQECAAGRVSNDDATGCDSCGPGNSIDPIDGCVPCVAGKVDADIDCTTSCDTCESGQYSEEEGTTACLVCGIGSYSPGNAPCVACSEGKADQDDNSRTPCESCPGQCTHNLASQPACPSIICSF